MTQGGSTEVDTTVHPAGATAVVDQPTAMAASHPSAEVTGAAALGDFGAEFRELAKQRRFVRGPGQPAPAQQAPTHQFPSLPAPHPQATQPAVQAPRSSQPAAASQHAAPAQQAAAMRAAAQSQPASRAVPPTAASSVAPAAPSFRATGAAQVAASGVSPAGWVPSSESAARAMDAERRGPEMLTLLAQLSRTTDHLVAAREELATVRSLAVQLQSEVSSSNDRLMAARVLVHDAQVATRQSAERATYLEARCETLQEALDIAVNASAFSRWRWRRKLVRERLGTEQG